MQYTSLHSLLSKEDVIRFGKESGGKTIIRDRQIKTLFDTNYGFKLFEENSVKRFYDFLGQYPALEVIKNTLVVRSCLVVSIKQYDEKLFRVGYESGHLLSLFFKYFADKYNWLKGIDLPAFLEEDTDGFTQEEMIEKTKEYFTEVFHILQKEIDQMEESMKKAPMYKARLFIELEHMRRDKTACRYIINHLKKLIDEYDEMVENELFLTHVNLDKLELFFAYVANDIIESEGILSHDGEKQEAIQYLEKYFAITEYLSKRADKPYDAKIAFAGEIMDYTSLKKLIKESYEEHKDLYDECLTGITIEKILTQYLPDARKKLRTEDIETHLQLNWNLVPYGQGEKNIPTSWSSNNARRTVPSIDREEKDYALLKEKEEFYPTTNPRYVIDGRNAYDGYGGYIYANGLVVLEKFKVEKGKNREVVPVHEEGFVVMNIIDLIEMSKYSKTELIELTREGKNKSVQRKYHSKKWKENLLKLINKPATDYDFDEIDEIIQDVLLQAIEKEKSLKNKLRK